MTSPYFQDGLRADGKMPPRYDVTIHPHVRLSPRDKALLRQWLR